MSARYNIPGTLVCLIVLSIANSAGLGETGDSVTAEKPTQAEFEAKIQEAAKASTAADFEMFVAEFKAMGPAPRLQKMLAARYLMSQSKERVVLLHMLDAIGVEHAVKALPPIAADFAKARPNHPNDMSFAGFYVLEKFMLLAWKKLPAEKDKQDVKMKAVEVKKLTTEPKPAAVDEHKLTRLAPDGFTHTGSLADRKAIRQLILEKGLHAAKKNQAAYPVPTAEDSDWVRVIGSHAFVRLREKYSGVDHLFIKSKDGQWSHLAELGHWVN